jgi:Raf kinase inhibitor-like YbhB/YbcL family protein
MWRRLLSLAVACGALSVPAIASSLTLQTSAFLNDGSIPKTDAAEPCGGRNLTPPLLLTGAPKEARSFAVVLLDTDAGGAKGFVHWVAYGIAPALTTLPPGFGSQPSAAYTGGKNSLGNTVYFGPCPPAGAPAHHYVFTAYALDLAPGALAAGLTRADFLQAIAGHTLAQASISGRFGR